MLRTPSRKLASNVGTYCMMKESMIRTNPDAWNFDNDDKQLISINERNKIEYRDLMEFNQGSPLGGKCYWVEENGERHLIENWCGGPPVWDNDGKRVAIPVWTRKIFKGTVQQISVLDITTRLLTRYKKTFNVLEFKSFDKNQICGLDRPRFNLREEICFDLETEKVDGKRKL